MKYRFTSSILCTLLLSCIFASAQKDTTAAKKDTALAAGHQPIIDTTAKMTSDSAATAGAKTAITNGTTPSVHAVQKR